MILFVDDNSGILFIKRFFDKLWGTINTYTTIVADLTRSTTIEFIFGSIVTDSTLLGQLLGFGRLSGHIWTRSGVLATFDKWITEIIDKVSEITKIFKKNSDIDGD